MDEATLIRRAASGDRRAFGLLVSAHQQGVYRWIRRLVHGEETARDLTQETFLRAWRSLPRFRGGAALGTWLRTIATNVARTHLGREARVAWVPLDDRLTAREPAPDAALQAASLREALARAVAELPPRQRDVVLLRVYRELPYAEVARELRCSENSAKVSFHHAVKRLRRTMAGGPARAAVGGEEGGA